MEFDKDYIEYNKKWMTPERYEYLGEPTLTRGDYGEQVRYGYNLYHNGYIYVWDATYGWFLWCSVELGTTSGDWVRVSPY